MSNNILIRASAGSGKTYQLSNRFLKIALREESWDAILASTFTKKAAGEILDRVLVRMAGAALDEQQRKTLSKDLGQNISPDQIKAILFNAVRNLHRLRVGTLDSFFIQIAKNFCLELGIPLGWNIVEEMENERFLSEAIREVFNQKPGEATELLKLLSHGEATRSVGQEVFDLSKKLLHLYRESPEKAWKIIEHQSTLNTEEINQALAELQQAPLPLTQKKEPDGNFVKARDACVSRIIEQNWDALLESGLAAKVIDGSYKYSRKAIEGDLCNALEKLAAHAKSELVNRLKFQTEATYELLKLVSEQYERIKEENRAFRFEDIPLRLNNSEVLRVDLHDNQNGLNRISHRLDSQMRHLLLDEFQDTAPIQWDILRPFVFSAIHSTQRHDGSFFCVGDMKQAIYGWRGGVAEIFMKVEQEITPLDIQSISVTFRPSPPVVKTVNALFENLPHNEVVNADDQEDLLDAARRWGARFEPHVTTKTHLSGYCTLETAPLFDPENPIKEDADLWDDEDFDDTTDKDSRESTGSGVTEETKQSQTTLRYTITRIKQLHAQAPGASMGVLVRTNRAVMAIIRGLTRLGIEASEEGGNPLTDSPAVEVILSALILADHPGDTVRRFHLANSPLGPELGITNEKNDADAANASFRIRSDLLQRGYGAVLNDWIRILAPSCDQRNLDRLLQLLKLAYAWDADAAIRTDRFVEMVRTKSVENSSVAKIRVMTIHQSKGLQFDIVVLPELEKRILGQAPPVVFGRETTDDGQPDPTAPIDRVLRYTNKTVQSFLPEKFRGMFSDFRRGQAEEAFCLLYVAMTRPIHCLCMIIPPLKPTKNKPTPRKTFDGILRCGLLQEHLEDAPESLLYENGDHRWYQNHPELLETPSKKRNEIPDEKCVAIELSETEETTRIVPRFVPSDMEGIEMRNIRWSEPFPVPFEPAPPEKMTPQQEQQQPRRQIWDDLATQRDAMLWGTAVHACFEKVTWLDETRPSRKELEKMLVDLARPLPGQLNIPTVLSAFEKACEKPAILKSLSYSHFGTFIEQTDGPGLTHRVFSERNFVVPWSGGLMRGSFDRLVVSYRNGEAVSARIIDFKTDSFPRTHDEASWNAKLQEKVEFYAPQLFAYRDAVSRLYQIPVQNIQLLLMFTSSGRVVAMSQQ